MNRMKLNKNNIYLGSLIVSSSIVLFSILFSSKEESFIPPTYIENTVDENIVKNKILEEYDETFDMLYINNNTNHLGKSYKVLRFADSQSYYKVMFTITYVNYDVDGTSIYSICDAFTEEELFKSYKKVDLNNIYDRSEMFKDATIISYDEINDLEKYIYMEGVDKSTLDIIPYNIETMMVTDEYMGNIYTSIIPRNLRVNLNYDKENQLIR